MNETTYTPVTDGFHDCKIVFAKRIETAYKHDVSKHVVLEMSLVATDTDIENPATYKAVFPVIIAQGFEWGFFDDKENNVATWRKATNKDTNNSLNNTLKCFPKWEEYCASLPDELESENIAYAWFSNKELVKDVIVRAKLMRGEPYTGTDGMEHENLNARIYAPFEAKPIVADDEARRLSQARKAAGVKLFGKPKAASAANAAPVPPAPKPKQKTVDEAREDAFAKYQEMFAADKTGAGFYPKCSEIIGRDMNTWESWTVADWTKITNEMTDIPF